jgi:hypothetical protein
MMPRPVCCTCGSAVRFESHGHVVSRRGLVRHRVCPIVRGRPHEARPGRKFASFRQAMGPKGFL